MSAKQCPICKKYYFGEECLECKDKEGFDNAFIEDFPNVFKDIFNCNPRSTRRE
jgi:hypothetical protein